MARQQTPSPGNAGVRDAVGRAIDRACAYWAKGDAASALASCREALALDPSSVAGLANIGTIMWLSGDSDQAEKHYLRAHALDPSHAGVAINLATLRNEAGDLEGSLQWIDKAEAHRPDSPEVIWRRSLLELAMGDYVNGWSHYEAGLGLDALRGRAPDFGTPSWDGSACDRLLLWHEQGLGDTVQFVRYAKLCRERARRVTVLCPTNLLALIESCPYVDDAVDRVQTGTFDRHVSIMSLPSIFRTTMETIPVRTPYLFADTTRVATWAERMRAARSEGGALKVGLVWAGQSRQGELRFQVIDRSRNMSLDAMRPWLDIAGIDYYSLQKGEPAAECRGTPIVDLMGDVADFADTAAIIANLDLVISVDTAVAHVAGAMGKPVWILSRVDACWRWLRNRPESPWYPTARVFGQAKRGDWSGVVDAVGRQLASRSAPPDAA